MTYIDPPDMPEDERMNSAEFRCVREFLGLTQEALAAALGVADRTIRRWEAGTDLIPDGARLDIEALEESTMRAVLALVGELRDAPDPTAVVYRTDAEYHAAEPSARMPASWHRMVIMRAAQVVEGVSIVYKSALVRA